MAQSAEELLWKVAESDEVDIETSGKGKSPTHRTTIWIVPVKNGVYIRSFKGSRGRWYKEAVANPHVTILVGRRRLKARVEPEKSANVNREVSEGYRKKYGERWPEETEPMVKRPVTGTTLRLQAVAE